LILQASSRKTAESVDKSGAGFTIVELMIVVIIAGILSTMAVPRVSKSVENTKVNQGVAGMQSIWLAQRRYRLQHDKFCPSIKDLVEEGFLDKRLKEMKDPFRFDVFLRGKDGLRITAQRASSSGWSGELTLNELGEVRGHVIDSGGNAVSP
jgi:prepilin-type N-terminal cleavage/methylation domain-containing protein